MFKIVIWGTGSNAKDFWFSIQNTELNVVAFVDYAEELQETMFFDKPVMPPSVLTSMEFDYLVIASYAASSIRIQAKDLFVPPEKVTTTAHVITIQMLAANHPKAKQANRLETLGWYYDYELLPGIYTYGKTPMNTKLLDDAFVGDVRDARILVIGAHDGAYAFDMEQRGVKEVVAFDTPETWSHPFQFAANMRNSEVKGVVDSLDNLSFSVYGKFEAVCLYRMQALPRHPMELLRRASNVLRAGGTLYFEGLIADYLQRRFSRMLEGGADRCPDEGVLRFLQDRIKVDESGKNSIDVLVEEGKRTLAFPSDGEDGILSNIVGRTTTCPGALLGIGDDLVHVPSLNCLRSWLEECGLSDVTLHIDEDTASIYGKAVKSYQKTRYSLSNSYQPNPRLWHTKNLHLVCISGAPRSGTTYLQRTLMNVTEFAGIDDEQYVDLFASILRCVDLNNSNEAIDDNLDIFFQMLHQYKIPQHIVDQTTPALFSLIGIYKNSRVLGARFLDRILEENIAPDTRYYVANRPYPEPTYIEDLAFYCQESSLFRHLHHILPVRHPLDIWASGCQKFNWWRTNKFRFNVVLKNWFRVYRAALATDAIFIDYNRLQEDPQTAMDCIASRIGVRDIPAMLFRKSTVEQVELRLTLEQKEMVDSLWGQIPFAN